MSLSILAGASGAASIALPHPLPSIPMPIARRRPRGASPELASPCALARVVSRRADGGVALKAGDTLYEAGAFAEVSWRVVSGALRLDLAQPDSARCVHIALAGDSVGIEALCGLPTLYRARAITRCVVKAVAVPSEAERSGAIGDAWARQWCRAADLTALRTGPIAERVRHLLLLLGAQPGPDADGLTHVELPCLKDIAAIVDTAPETASRILGVWRRQDVLHSTAPAHVAFERDRLAGVEIAAGISSGTAVAAERAGV